MGMNFDAILMEIAFLVCGAVMGKKIVKMVVMKKAVMVPYDCVITRPNFPVGAQVRGTLCSASAFGFLDVESLWLILNPYLTFINSILVFQVGLLMFYIEP